MGQPYGFVARCSVLDACFESEDIFDKVYDLVEIPLEESRGVLVHEESLSLGFHDIVLPNPLDHSHVSPCVHNPLFPPSIL